MRRFSARGKLDNAEFAAAFPGFAAMEGKSLVPMLLTAQAEVRAPGSGTVSARTSAVVLPTPFFLGLRPGADPAGNPVIEYARLTYDPAASIPAAAGALEVVVERIDWDYALVQEDGGLRRRWRRTLVPAAKFTCDFSGPAASGTIALPRDLKNGGYLVRVSDVSGPASEVELWHHAGDGGGRSGDPSTLQFAFDKEKYAPGETAKVRFTAPGVGELFVVSGCGAIARSGARQAAAGENEIEIPIPADLTSGNYFVAVTWAGGSGRDTVRSFGIAELAVDQKLRQLAVTLDAPEVSRPNSKSRVKVRLRDADGRPVSGTVQLFAVDAGIASLTGYAAPAIFDFFHGRFADTTLHYEIYGDINPEIRITPDGRIGGDGAFGRGAPGALARSRSGAEAETSAIVVLDAVKVPDSGEVELELALPDHTGAMKLFAVAANAKSVGSAEAETKLVEELTLLAAAPRAVNANDEFEIEYTVFNHDLPEGEYRLAVALPAGAEALGENRFSGTLGRGRSAVHTLRCKLAGARKQQFSAEFGLSGKKCRRDVSVAVRSASVPRTATRYLQIAPGGKLEIAADASQWAAPPEVTLRVTDTPLAGVEHALGWLDRYPYGCLEQTTARAFPLLGAPALAAAGVIPRHRAETAGAMLETVCCDLAGMLRFDGSFSMWRGGVDSWDDASLFAAHLLVSIRDSKMAVPPPEMLAAVKKFLRRCVGESSRPREQRAYASLILAQFGDAAFLVPARNLLREEKTDYATLLAAAALIRGGYAAEGAESLRRALAAEVWRDGRLAAYSDENASVGMTLWLVADIAENPTLMFELADRLHRSLRPDGTGWGTTQSNAWALLGMAKFAEAFPAAGMDAKIICGGRESRADGNPVKLAAGEKAVVVNRGKNPVFVALTESGTPKTPPATGGEIKLVRRYRDQSGREITEAKHGELVTVEITVSSPRSLENVAICDLLPGGLAIEDDRLATRSAPVPRATDNERKLYPSCLVRGDDRFLLFADLDRCDGDGAAFTYRARAVNRGVYKTPVLAAEAMYAPDVNGIFSPSGNFIVR